MNNKYYKEGTDLTYTDITHEQERELFVKAKAGDQKSADFLVTNHLLFAANEGRKWSRGKLPEDEVISAANEALMIAFGRFDPTRNNRFSSFLRPFIRGAIATLWRSKNAVDTPEGGHSGVPLDDNDRGSLSDFVIAENEDQVLAKRKPSRRDPTEEQTVEQDEHAEFMIQLLDEAKGVLDPEESRVIQLYFGEERRTLDDIAKLLQLKDRRYAHQIKNRAIEKLKKRLAKSMAESGVER